MDAPLLDVDLVLVRESARDFLTRRGQQDSLADLAALDWLGLLVGEEFGGTGWMPVEAAVIAEELGRAGDLSAWLGGAVAAAALSTAPVECRTQWLPRVLDGTARAAVTVAGDTVRIAGADRVDILVTVGSDGVDIVDLSEATRCRDEDVLDVQRPVWLVSLGDSAPVRIGTPARAQELLAAARVLLAADSVGAAAATLSRLTSHLRDRRAFGAPIASFQAVQHRLVDLLMFEVKARAIVMKAARALAGDDPQAVTLSAVAHAFTAAHATAAVDECMQLSGGIGFTWEYPLHHELRRVFTNCHLLQSVRDSRGQLAGMWGW